MVEIGKRAEDRAFTDCPEAAQARSGPGMLPTRSQETATRQTLQRGVVNGGIEVAGGSIDVEDWELFWYAETAAENEMAYAHGTSSTVARCDAATPIGEDGDS
jgi:hypothetical protein